MKMKSKQLKCIAGLAVLLLVICFLRSCCDALLVAGREIRTYPSAGFMETVSFGVEWLSENQFRMTYDDKDDEFDEEYIITILE